MSRSKSRPQADFERRGAFANSATPARLQDTARGYPVGMAADDPAERERESRESSETNYEERGEEEREEREGAAEELEQDLDTMSSEGGPTPDD